MESLAKNLKELRTEKGVTQKVISTKLGIALSTYSNYEQGTREPSYEILIKLCQYFHVTADFLLGINNCDHDF